VQLWSNLAVPDTNECRNLTVELSPAAQKLEPGDKASIRVQVSDYQGKAVDSGELTLYAVDESVLSLTGYPLPDPVEIFYREVDEGVMDYRLRDSMLLLSQSAKADMEEEVMASGVRASSDGAMRMEAAALGDSTKPLRTDFSALATFEASVVLDTAGQATVEFDLPDNLTRYRVM